jgi:hypothetical protein
MIWFEPYHETTSQTREKPEGKQGAAPVIKEVDSSHYMTDSHSPVPLNYMIGSFMSSFFWHKIRGCALINTPANTFIDLSFRRKPESSKKTGCRIKSGMTYFDIFTCRSNNFQTCFIFVQCVVFFTHTRLLRDPGFSCFVFRPEGALVKFIIIFDCLRYSQPPFILSPEPSGMAIAYRGQRGSPVQRRPGGQKRLTSMTRDVRFSSIFKN